MRKYVYAGILIVAYPLIVASQAFTPAFAAGVPGPQEPTSARPNDNATASVSPQEKPRVFITDSESWEIEGAAGGTNGAFGAESHGGARPQTAEIIKTFGQRCPQVIVNNRQNVADYVVVLQHEGGKGLLRHKDKVAVFQRLSGDAVMSHSTLSVGGSVEDACKGIMGDWASHGAQIIASRERKTVPAPEPVLSAGSESASDVPLAITSTPTGADIQIDGAFVGDTPSTVTVKRGTHEITVKKAGFNDWTRKLNVTGGSIHLDATLDAAPTQTPAATSAQ